MIENEIWNNNPNQFVIGADEVGRGSIAGPIVAASVREIRGSPKASVFPDPVGARQQISRPSIASGIASC